MLPVTFPSAPRALRSGASTPVGRVFSLVKIRFSSVRKIVSGVATAAALGLAAFAGVTSAAGTAQAASPGPCDIYAGGATPCVAAYSTVRALYHGYFGPMYQVTRASDDRAAEIWTTRPGGYADAAAQTAFCAGTTCTISRLYDQSGHGNTLGLEPIGGNGSPHVGAVAPPPAGDTPAPPAL